MKEQRIGWLGTGRMGTAMASRLLAAGYRDMAVWNRTAAKAGPLVSAGAQQVDRIAQLRSCDIVFTTVMSSPDLLAVAIGEGGLLTGPSTPKILVDCSTVSPDASAEVREAAARCGTAMLAAPISGNPAMVSEGKAAIAASGPLHAFDSVRPLLESIAATVVHCGTGEEARLLKLCHNLISGTLTAALAEAAVLAEKSGVDVASFLDFLDGSVMSSTFITEKGKAIRARDYTPTFTLEDQRKDFDLGMAAARAAEVPMPLAATTHQLIQVAIGRGFRNEDYVTVYELAAQSAGIDHGGKSW